MAHFLYTVLLQFYFIHLSEGVDAGQFYAEDRHVAVEALKLSPTHIRCGTTSNNVSRTHPSCIPSQNDRGQLQRCADIALLLDRVAEFIDSTCNFPVGFCKGIEQGLLEGFNVGLAYGTGEGWSDGLNVRLVEKVLVKDVRTASLSDPQNETEVYMARPNR
jgi:hypothetical protein